MRAVIWDEYPPFALKGPDVLKLILISILAALLLILGSYLDAAQVTHDWEAARREIGVLCVIAFFAALLARPLLRTTPTHDAHL